MPLLVIPRDEEYKGANEEKQRLSEGRKKRIQETRQRKEEREKDRTNERHDTKEKEEKQIVQSENWMFRIYYFLGYIFCSLVSGGERKASRALCRNE